MVRFLDYTLLSHPRTVTRKEQAMYTVIRKYDLVPGTAEEFLQHVQKSLVPIISRVPGFREYSMVEVGDNEVVSISIFESLADAKVSARQTAGWVAEHTELFLQGFSKAMAGQVRVHSGPACLQRTGHEELLQGVF
jgi:heme-degrading monooxygenase HmoA